MRASVSLVAAALVVTGCGLPIDDHARQLAPSAAPYGVLSPRATPATQGRSRLVVYLTRGGHLVASTRPSEAPPTPQAVLAALAVGATAHERAAGLTSALALGTKARITSVEDGQVTVSLPAGDDVSRVDAALGFGQIVLSLTRLEPVRAVRFERRGAPLRVPRGDGSLTDEPLTALDYEDLVDA